MIIKKSKFVTSMAEFKTFPGQGLPEIALAGKSNVGKSSLINSLTNNSKLARTSSAPGKTRLVNFYQLNDEDMFLVDLPGYGFAKAPRQEKEKWAAMIEGYLEKSQHLRHVLQLVDIRHDPTQDDIDMVSFLRASGIPFQIVCTKADKISRGSRMKYTAAIGRALQAQPWELICVSSETGEGRDQLIRCMGEAIKTPVEFIEEDELTDEEIIDEE